MVQAGGQGFDVVGHPELFLGRAGLLGKGRRLAKAKGRQGRHRRVGPRLSQAGETTDRQGERGDGELSRTHMDDPKCKERADGPGRVCRVKSRAARYSAWSTAKRRAGLIGT